MTLFQHNLHQTVINKCCWVTFLLPILWSHICIVTLLSTSYLRFTVRDLGLCSSACILLALQSIVFTALECGFLCHIKSSRWCKSNQTLGSRGTRVWGVIWLAVLQCWETMLETLKIVSQHFHCFQRISHLQQQTPKLVTNKKKNEYTRNITFEILLKIVKLQWQLLMHISCTGTFPSAADSCYGLQWSTSPTTSCWTIKSIIMPTDMISPVSNGIYIQAAWNDRSEKKERWSREGGKNRKDQSPFLLENIAI